MSLPKFPKPESILTREKAIDAILTSIAMEEAALSHVITAESEKINFVIEHARCQNICIDKILEVNKSAASLLEQVNDMQIILKNKMRLAASFLPPHPDKPCPKPKPCPPPKPCPKPKPCPPPKPCPKPEPCPPKPWPNPKPCPPPKPCPKPKPCPPPEPCPEPKPCPPPKPCPEPKPCPKQCRHCGAKSSRNIWNCFDKIPADQVCQKCQERNHSSRTNMGFLSQKPTHKSNDKDFSGK